MRRVASIFGGGGSAPKPRTAEDYRRAAAHSMTFATSAEDTRARLEAHGVLGWVEKACRRHGVLFAEVADDRAGIRGNPRVCAARHEIWAVLHGTLGLAVVQIARDFGRDHTSIMYALNRREDAVREELGLEAPTMKRAC